MFFKRTKLVALMLPWLATGCSLALNEEIQKSEIRVNPVQSGCLSNTAPLFVRYFDGQTEAAEVDAYFACLEKAVDTFSQHTEGSNPNYFTGEELAAFFSKYFLQDKAISPSLVRELMLLKQGVLGGESGQFTQKELRQTITLLQAMRKVSLRLRPHMPIRVDSFIERKMKPAEFELAIQDFQEGMNEVGKALEDTQGSYSFDRLSNLLQQLRAFMYPDASANDLWVDSAIRWTTALRPAKHIFIAPPQDEIRATDWAKIYFLAPRYYGLYLRMMFYAKSKDNYFAGEGLRSLENLFTDATVLFQKALENHPHGVISSTEVKALLEALVANKMVPESVTVDSADAFVRAVFGRIFVSASTPNSYTITRANLDRVTESFRFGTEGLRAIEAAFARTAEEISPADLAKIPSRDLLEATALQNEISREAIESVKRVGAEVKTIFPKNSPVVFVPEKEPLTKISAGHLAKVHLLHTLNRLLIQAYGAKKTMLSEAEVSVLADDVFPVLTGYSLVGNDTRASIPKRLFEASLFLYSSDGDTSVTVNEAAEFETLLLSTIHRANVLHTYLAEQCKAGKLDARGKALIPTKCYREQFLKIQKETWAYIPGFAKYVSELDEKKQKEIFSGMENFLRKDRLREDFGHSDTCSFILLPYYVELLFSRFDLNRDGLFDNKEAELAYPVFRPFLAAKATEKGLTTPAEHHAVYVFLLGYQDLPNNMPKTWVARQWLTWWDMEIKADRGQVVRIFEKLLSK